MTGRAIRNIGITGAAGLLLAAALARTAAASDLIEVYQKALRNDPQLREAEATRLATLESKPQALALLLPQVNATGGYTHGDYSDRSVAPITNAQGQPVLPSQSFDTYSTSRTDVTQWGVTLRQTIFRWDRIAGLRQADAKVAQAEIDYRAAQQDLILRTATRYFDVLAQKDALGAAEAARDSFARQLEQAEKRFEVGLIAITDVQEARAAADTSAATVIEAKRTLATARDRLRELTGETFALLVKPGDDMPLVTPDPVDEEQWVHAALDQNLSLSSARIGVDIAREQIAIARGGHLPTLDLVAGRTGSTTSGSATESYVGPPAFGYQAPFSFPGDAGHGDRTIGLQLTVPIYAGGETSSQVREAVYRQRAAKERLEFTARATERATRDSYLGVNADISRVRALRQALESSRVAMSATEAGYDVGTRTQVDVLLARQRLFQAQTDYLKSRYDYITDLLTLEQASGQLDEARLSRVNQWLKETVSVQ